MQALPILLYLPWRTTQRAILCAWSVTLQRGGTERRLISMLSYVLDKLGSKEALVHSEVTVPWKSRGKVSHWKTIFIDPSVQTEEPGKFPTSKYSRLLM